MSTGGQWEGAIDGGLTCDLFSYLLVLFELTQTSL